MTHPMTYPSIQQIELEAHWKSQASLGHTANPRTSCATQPIQDQPVLHSQSKASLCTQPIQGQPGPHSQSWAILSHTANPRPACATQPIPDQPGPHSQSRASLGRTANPRPAWATQLVPPGLQSLMLNNSSMLGKGRIRRGRQGTQERHHVMYTNKMY